MWEFENYRVFKETVDILRFEDMKGNFLGTVLVDAGGQDLISELNNGADPINERWEDGVGNTITLEGWEHYDNHLQSLEY